MQEMQVSSLCVGKIAWRRKWQPTLVVLPGKSHGQRSLVDYIPWGCKIVRHDIETKQQQIGYLSGTELLTDHEIRL